MRARHLLHGLNVPHFTIREFVLQIRRTMEGVPVSTFNTIVLEWSEINEAGREKLRQFIESQSPNMTRFKAPFAVAVVSEGCPIIAALCIERSGRGWSFGACLAKELPNRPPEDPRPSDLALNAAQEWCDAQSG
jgi:hypothetical protein